MLQSASSPANVAFSEKSSCRARQFDPDPPFGWPQPQGKSCGNCCDEFDAHLHTPSWPSSVAPTHHVLVPSSRYVSYKRSFRNSYCSTLFHSTNRPCKAEQADKDEERQDHPATFFDDFRLIAPYFFGLVRPTLQTQ